MLPTSMYIDEMARRRMQGLILRGATYRIKSKIKEAGGQWCTYAQAWLVPDHPTALMLGGIPRAGYYEIPKAGTECTCPICQRKYTTPQE